jgi:hypothetical protein
MKKFMLFCLFSLGLISNSSVFGMEREKKSQEASYQKLLTRPAVIAAIKIAIALTLVAMGKNLHSNQYNGIGRDAFISAMISASAYAVICEQSYSREDLENTKAFILAWYVISMQFLVGSVSLD